MPCATHHVVNNLVDLANREFQYQVDGLVVVVPALYVGHCVLGLDAIAPAFNAAVAGDGIFFFHHPQTDNLVAVVDQLVDEPLQGIDRVLVLVEAA